MCGSLTPKNVFLQILKSVNDLEILAPELVGGQSEMVVLTILSHIFMIMRLITWKPSYVICRVSTTLKTDIGAKYAIHCWNSRKERYFCVVRFLKTLLPIN